MMIERPTKVTLVGRGKINLNPADHLATGGEGSVYKLSDGTIIKLYTDTAKMIRDGIPKKIASLKGMKHPYIVSPTDLVTGVGGKPIGFYMPFAEGEALSRVFTNAFRTREGFNDAHATTLVGRMREVVQYAHGHNAMLVDANELNWIAVPHGLQGPEPRVIDVDSWVVDGNVPSSVPKMLSIRDWMSPLVSRESDWFAWGVVTFQVFTGIHPYKGTLKGYGLSELERRMRDNVSVFTPGVRLNAAVRDFGCINGPLLGWYEATFQNKERSVPPSPFETGATTAKVAKVARVVVTGQGNLVYDRLLSIPGNPVVRVFSCGVALCDDGSLYALADARKIGIVRSRKCEVVRRANGWLVADWEDGMLSFSYINGSGLHTEKLSFTVQSKKVLVSGERLFVVTEYGLTEVSFQMFTKPILSAGQTWGAQTNSTRWFDGVGVQDSMGAKFIIMPFGERACVQVRVRELDGLTPIAAKASDRFAVIVAVDKTGGYQKLELTFNREHTTYAIWQGGSDTPDLNMALLTKGVAAGIVTDGELCVYVPTSGALNKVADKDIATDMLLGNWENKVVYIRDGNVWSVAMR